jgi:glycosyltransferase involved in cell wall biosynthesis
MHILFMTQVLPFPLDAGPKIRAYHVIRYLAEAGHKVHLLSFVRPGESDEHVESLRRLCASVSTVPLVRSRIGNVRDGIRSVLTTTPFLVLRDQVAAMRDKLHQVAASRSFDALHADQLWMAPYGMNGVNPGLRVLDQHNAVYLIPRRMAEHHPNRVARTLLRNEAVKLEAFERDACRRFDRVVWVTEEDRKALATTGENRGGRDAVIPIAIDPAIQAVIKRPQPFRVTFLGGMHWPPNMEGVSWFVEKVWPLVARAVPSAVLTLVGKEPSRKAPSLEQAQRVEVTGYVADPHRYLAETAVFIVPLHAGAGMRVKILDAWSWGLPIVSTTVGAEGLKATHGENVLIADTAEAFADSVIGVLRNRRMAQRLADNGRSTVEMHYDWKNVYRAWDQVYQS